MENCQCSGSYERPPCSKIQATELAFNTHEDLCGLIFTRSNASKLFGLDDSETLTPGSSSKFTLFPNLPAELRLEIWKFALSVPRLIAVSYTHTTRETVPKPFVDAPPPPACLSVCRESRGEALKMYSKHLITMRCSVPTYLNFSTDCFLLGSPDSYVDVDHLMYILLPENSHRAQFLHVSKGCWDNFADWRWLRSEFRGLEQLTISFPQGATLVPYTHDCEYCAVSRDEKESRFIAEMFCEGDDEKRWQPWFKLDIVHYDSPPAKGEYPDY